MIGEQEICVFLTDCGHTTGLTIINSTRHKLVTSTSSSNIKTVRHVEDAIRGLAVVVIVLSRLLELFKNDLGSGNLKLIDERSESTGDREINNYVVYTLII